AERAQLRLQVTDAKDNKGPIQVDAGTRREDPSEATTHIAGKAGGEAERVATLDQHGVQVAEHGSEPVMGPRLGRDTRTSIGFVQCGIKRADFLLAQAAP